MKGEENAGWKCDDALRAAAAVACHVGSPDESQGYYAEQIHRQVAAYRWLCEARLELGVTDRAMALLNALLSFYPHGDLAEENGLIVFPSNAQLSLRARGMAEQTIRRHLSLLIDAGLLTRKDSANGKRYARRDGAGDINEAFGFSLAPLLARAEEIASKVIAERVELQRLKERLTICRRGIAKLIVTALDEQAQGDWEAINGGLSQSFFA